MSQGEVRCLHERLWCRGYVCQSVTPMFIQMHLMSTRKLQDTLSSHWSTCDLTLSCDGSVDKYVESIRKKISISWAMCPAMLRCQTLSDFNFIADTSVERWVDSMYMFSNSILNWFIANSQSIKFSQLDINIRSFEGMCKIFIFKMILIILRQVL